MYLKAIGIVACIASLLISSTGQGMAVGSNVWLAEWSDNPTSNETTVEVRLGVYAGLGLGQGKFYYGQLNFIRGNENKGFSMTKLVPNGSEFTGVLAFVGSMVTAYYMINAAAKLHKALLRNLLRSPMSFYDTTPLGRVLNRCGKVGTIV